MSPDEAFDKYIRHCFNKAGWMEESVRIDEDIALSKRELFALILLADLLNQATTPGDWRVGFDSEGIQPNDGFVTDGKKSIYAEHKLVPQFVDRDPLAAIKDTYAKYAKRGEAYGQNRTLIVYCNRASPTVVQISSLRDAIRLDGHCPFDQVLLMHVHVRLDLRGMAIFYVSSHFPELAGAEVAVFPDGRRVVRFCRIKFVGIDC